MNSKAYDIVLVPGKRLSNEAIKLSQKLKSYGSYFTLDNKSFFPHVSLYMLQLSGDSLDDVVQILEKIAGECRVIEATANKYHYESEYVDIEYARTNEFSELQDKIIKKLNPVRDGLRDKDKIRLKSAVGEEKENIQKYGYRSVGNQFHPHLTFTRFTNDQKDILQILPPRTIFNGKYETIGLYEMGDNGTCIREVEKWNF